MLEGVALVAHPGQPLVGGGDHLGEPPGQDVAGEPHLQPVVGGGAVGERRQPGGELERRRAPAPRLPSAPRRSATRPASRCARAWARASAVAGAASRPSPCCSWSASSVEQVGGVTAAAARSAGVGQHRLGGRQRLVVLADAASRGPSRSSGSSTAASAAARSANPASVAAASRPARRRVGDGASARSASRQAASASSQAAARRRDAPPATPASRGAGAVEHAGQLAGDGLLPRPAAPRGRSRSAVSSSSDRLARLAEPGEVGLDLLDPGGDADEVAGHRWRAARPRPRRRRAPAAASSVAGRCSWATASRVSRSRTGRRGRAGRPRRRRPACGRPSRRPRRARRSRALAQARVVGRAAHRAVVADREGAGQLGGHPVDAAPAGGAATPPCAGAARRPRRCAARGPGRARRSRLGHLRGALAGVAQRVDAGPGGCEGEQRVLRLGVRGWRARVSSLGEVASSVGDGGRRASESSAAPAPTRPDRPASAARASSRGWSARVRAAASTASCRALADRGGVEGLRRRPRAGRRRRRCAGCGARPRSRDARCWRTARSCSGSDRGGPPGAASRRTRVRTARRPSVGASRSRASSASAWVALQLGEPAGLVEGGAGPGLGVGRAADGVGGLGGTGRGAFALQRRPVLDLAGAGRDGQVVGVPAVGQRRAGGLAHPADQVGHHLVVTAGLAAQRAAPVAQPALDVLEAGGAEQLLQQLVPLLGPGPQERLEPALRAASRPGRTG